LNFFLYINRKLIFVFASIIVLVFLLLIFFKQINLTNVDTNTFKKDIPDVDIEQPKFAINNETKKIFITANEGNFLDNNNILLNENVRFKSNDFSIETEKVIFNRTEQTANSTTKSLFKAENTKISSEGFDIFDKGDKIIFYGKSFIVLKWVFFLI